MMLRLINFFGSFSLGFYSKANKHRIILTWFCSCWYNLLKSFRRNCKQQRNDWLTGASCWLQHLIHTHTLSNIHQHPVMCTNLITMTSPMYYNWRPNLWHLHPHILIIMPWDWQWWEQIKNLRTISLQHLNLRDANMIWKEKERYSWFWKNNILIIYGLCS